MYTYLMAHEQPTYSKAKYKIPRRPKGMQSQHVQFTFSPEGLKAIRAFCRKNKLNMSAWVEGTMVAQISKSRNAQPVEGASSPG